MPPRVMPSSVMLPARDLHAMQRRIVDLEDALRIQRRRAELLENTARRAFNVGGWGDARRAPQNEETT